jgi:hypothetical protein
LAHDPKPDAQQAPAVNDAGVEQLWMVDTDGRAVLVAQGSTGQVDMALAADLGDSAHAETATYDGHVPLVLDAYELASIDATFDFLTTLPDLFDVPALDTSVAADDASGT